MFSISVEDSLPTELEIVMLALRPEVFSVAVTFKIPLTSTSKTTSSTASPAFIGGIGASVNSPSDVLSSQLTRSPWNTGNCTVCWLSATVVKVLSNELVSGHGGEGSADEDLILFFDCRHGLTAGNDLSKDVAFHGNAK